MFLRLVCTRAVASSSRTASRPVTSAFARYFAAEASALPDSIKRVGNADVFPNEQPGNDYAFNWSLNADGVTPLKGPAFRITKPLDLKVAGLTPAKTSPLKVKASAIPEAGSDALSFEVFDDVAQKTKDLLTLSETLYGPEGHVPGTRTGVRVITNSAAITPSLVAYLERAPKRDPASQPITAYVLEASELEEFAGYAIEEVEDEVEGGVEAKSVSSIVVVGRKPSIEKVVAGFEASVAGLAADEAERAKKKEEAEKEASE